MNKIIKRVLLTIGLGFIILVAVASPAPADNNTTITAPVSTTAASTLTNATPGPTTTSDNKNNDVVTNTNTGSSKVENPDLIATYGPPGGIIGTILVGAYWLVKAINDGRETDVARYKSRAEEAETNARNELAKVNEKLSSLETKLDKALFDLDKERSEFAARKAAWSQQLIDQERRHQDQLEVLMDTLNVHIRHNYNLEKLLSAHGIDVPEPPVKD